jgi:hypothetical protein
MAFPADTHAKAHIEGSEFDRRVLLEKLNERGLDRGLRFVQDDRAFGYRIEFATEQGTGWTWARSNGGAYKTSQAKATVYDENDMELFSFTSALRRTDSGATNAVAKEIIKRMLKLKEPPKG